MAVGALWAGIVAVLKVTRGRQRGDQLDHAELRRPGAGVLPAHRPVPGQPEGASIVSTTQIPESGWLPGLNGIFDVLGLANPPRQLYGFLIIAVVVGVVHLGAAQPHPLRLRPAGQRACRRRRPAPAASTPAAWSSRRCCSPARSPAWSACPTCWAARTSTRTDFTAGLGFLGIAVALLGRNKPGRHRPRRAAVRLPRPRARCRCRSRDFPASVVTIIQGTIVLAVVVANEIARRIARRAAERGQPRSRRRRTGRRTRRHPPRSTDASQGAQA